MLAPVLAAVLTFAAVDSGNTLRREGAYLVITEDRTGRVVASAPAAGTEQIVIRGLADRDDTLTIDLAQPFALAGGIDYDGGARGFDSLVLRGGFVREQRVTQLTPHDGIIDLDGLVIRYTNLEPITDTTPAATFVINGTAGADTVTVSNGPGGTTTVSSPTFESVTFANKTNVVFDGMGGGDSVNFNNPTPATGLVSFIVQNVATVTQSAALAYPLLGVSATGAVTLTNTSNDVNNVEITTQNGSIAFTDADDLTIGGVSPSLRGLYVATAGSVTATTQNGPMTLADTDGPEIVRSGLSSGFVVLNVFGSSTADLTVAVDNDAIASTTSIVVNASSDILLGTGGAAFSNNVTAGGQIQLNAPGDVVVDGQTVVTSDAYGTASGGNLLVSGASGVLIGGSVVAGGGAGADVRILGFIIDGVTIEGTVLSQSGDVSISAVDNLIIDPAASISAPLGRVTIDTFNTTPHIDLGSPGDGWTNGIEISDAELDRVFAPLAVIETFIGTITVSQPITFATHLNLRTPNFFTATGSGSLSAPTLTFDHTFPSPKTWTITPTTIQISGGAPVPYTATTLNANATVPSGMFPGGEASDTFLVTPSSTTTINVDGNLPAPPASPGDTLDFDLTGVVNPVLTLTLTGSGYQGSLTSANRQPVNFRDIETIVDAPVDLSVTKTDNATTANAGTAVTYTITVTNPSPLAVPGVLVTDAFPAQLTGVTWTCAPSPGSACPAAGSGNINQTVTLAASGGSVTFTATGTISPSATGTLTNTASVTTPAGFTETNAANNTATDTTTITQQADLALAKSGPAGTVPPGDTITYTITLRNAGPSDATNVVLTDVLPANTTFVSLAAPPSYACTTGATIQCTTATLAPSPTPDTFTLVVRVNDTTATGTAITNTVTATSNTADPTANSATATVIVADRPVDLGVTKTDNATTAIAGTAVTYTITVSNPSPAAVAGATVTDSFPAELTGVTWTCTPSSGSACTAAGSGNINQTVTLAANGGSVTFTATGTLRPSATGTLTNTASVTVPAGFAETNPANNTATDTTAVTQQSDLLLAKTAPGGTVAPGETITYTITLRNSGPSDASNVVLTDVLPANTTFVSLSAPPTYTCTTGPTVQCAIATLPPSATPDTFTLVVRVNTATAGATITNTATATSTTADPTPNSATATVTAGAAPAPIPTLSQWTLMLLAAALAFVALRRA